jgi:hypothetical protein
MFLVNSWCDLSPALGKSAYRGQFDANVAWPSGLESTKLSAWVPASQSDWTVDIERGV